jgi:hypothetical protein
LVDEDRLSPQLGRLIDEAKAAARLLDGTAPDAEGVALLMEDGAVHSGASSRLDVDGAAEKAVVDTTHSHPCAADLALEQARAGGDREILAAAVAAPHDPSETVFPGAGSYACLTEVDPELPLVLKQRGRWVVIPLSRVRLGS